MTKKIIVLLDNEYRPDSRVENEINAFLEDGYEIDLYCLKSDTLPDIEENYPFTIRREISPKLFRPFSSEYRNFEKEFAKKISEMKPEFIHCHDFRMFFIGCEIKKLFPAVKLIYDSHEYLRGYPYFYRIDSWRFKIKGMFVWFWYVYREMKLLKCASALITVSESLRKKLESRSGKTSILVRNIPPNSSICKGDCNYWHEKFQLPADIKVLVHTGNAHYSDKRLNFLIDEISKRKNLALVFLGSNSSIEKIKDLAKSKGVQNIFYHEQIPRKYVTYYCSQANFGLVYTWNKLWLSYWYALPNKLIDVSLAGIPVLSTNQPELKGFIDEHKHGVTFNGDCKKALSEALDKIIEREDELKAHARLIENKVSWSEEKKKLILLYTNLSKS